MTDPEDQVPDDQVRRDEAATPSEAGGGHIPSGGDEPPVGHRRILTALEVLRHDRPEVLAEFAQATLRRIPDSQLRNADPQAAARRILQAFEAIDRRRDDEVAIRMTVPTTGLDGRPRATTVIEVASEDRPFLLSTVVDELERRGYRVTRALHPIVGVERADDGRVTRILPARTAERRESLLHLELDDRVPDDRVDELRSELNRLVDDVMVATRDFAEMRARIEAVAQELHDGDWPHTDPDEALEAADLLEWLLDGNLLLLGVREYALVGSGDDRAIQVVAGSGLGLLADESGSRYAEPVRIADLPEPLRERAADPPLLTVTRTTRLSTVQRRVRMEYFGLVRRDEEGRPDREVRLLGLFTRKGLAEPARTTPVLREKLRAILEREDVVEGSHDEATMVSLFQALPKDELFQADVDELHRTTVSLFHAEEHREIRTLVRLDVHTRTVSVLVAVPRDAYSPQLRERIQRLLVERYSADRVDVDVSLGDRHEALARFLLHVSGPVPDVSVASLQRDVRQVARSWLDEVVADLMRRLGESEAQRLVTAVAHRLPRAYRDSSEVEEAVGDILLLDRLLSDDIELLVAFQNGDTTEPRLKAAKRGAPLELSSFLPILESVGLTVIEEIPHRLTDDVAPSAGPAQQAHLHDFGVRVVGFDVDADGPRVADAILAGWRGHLEIDALNRLVITAGLDWRDVAILRTYHRYRRQVGTPYTPEYVNETLVSHPDVVRALVRHIHARFDPALAHDQGATRAVVVAACDRLERLDHDRILRGLLHVVDATVRTNAFRPDAIADGSGEPYVALKIDPSTVPDATPPIPHREIFVRSPRVEGVHLRGGPVARGGLRWSDRRDDVRAEVLDLVKAQILKNALIVPTGAKGGFVLTREPDDPEALRDEVRRQYVTFVRGLLDVTDNLAGDEVLPPPDVLRHDGDDPYLVVAADRGTATFSDMANELSARYGFWLDDAFASGGSAGYDHKELGVTARGAWVAVQRHFRELGIDVQSDPVTVVGVGDMSGDVFGNGLLRSRAVKLVAAFDHRDIFLDPDPDPGASFDERQRLYDLPGSSWQDYDRDLISPGGGVFPRSVRTVPLPDEVRALLRLDAPELSPLELIRAILTAPVDLLFAGGIGTYVKASTERHEDLGDRSNEEVRVDAADLRARVIAEGANLFITQRGRIEYARRGGHLNQDAVDNVAGVATSDHEVNVKILLNLAMEDGRLVRGERDEMLADLADDVVAHVLRQVDLQTASLSQELDRSPRMLDAYDRFLERLETSSDLDRDVEVLPSTDELVARGEAGAGLTRPELATLLAWAKRHLKETLLASDVPDLGLLEPLLAEAFPAKLSERFEDLLPRHRLRRELIATLVANDVVDRMGATFVPSLAEESGFELPDVVVAYRLARELTQAQRWWDQLDAAALTHDPARLLEFEDQIDQLVAHITMSLVTDPLLSDPERLLARDQPVAASLITGMLTLGTDAQCRARLAHARWLVDDLVHEDLARLLACTRDLAMIPDVAAVLSEVGEHRGAVDVSDAFLRLGDQLGVDRLERVLGRLEATQPWSRRQHRGLASDLRRLRRDATRAALLDHPDVDEPGAVTAFLERRAPAIARAQGVIRDVEKAEDIGLDAVAVAVRAIWDAIEV